MDSKNDEGGENHNKRSPLPGRRECDSNILRLVQTKNTPHAGAIAVARELLTSTEQGRHTTVVYIAIGENDAVRGFVGIDAKCRNAIKGALLALANEV